MIGRTTVRRFLKFAAFTAVILAIFIAIGVTLTIGWRPFIGPRVRATTNRTFERTPERLARGKYLFNSVALCVDCHSEHDNTSKDWHVIAGTEGSGEIFPLEDLPGKITAPNLTSDPETGLGNWTDNEIARAIREGVDRNGVALFSLMPYKNYRAMSDEDLAAVVVYIRSLAPVRHALPPTEIIFPVKYLMRSDPEPVTAPVPPPDDSTPAKRGEYLTRMASCQDCHTPAQKGAPIAGLEFAGGMVMSGPFGSVATANITPDPTGISYYDDALFREVMRSGSVHARKLNALMPVDFYGGMTDEDLSAIFAYLKTIKPVAHRVDNTEAATLCKRCGFKHGLGDKN
jgi:Cytochrome c/Cytochrome C oxidase, cbb3-type, subunit III